MVAPGTYHDIYSHTDGDRHIELCICIYVCMDVCMHSNMPNVQCECNLTLHGYEQCR